MRGKWSRGGKRHTYIRAGDMKETLDKKEKAGGGGAYKKDFKR